ncbi:MAG: hypothetical protein KatS3mg043_1294 [Rhodothermaceae bacterium]|nr:MAG: hypothetical protein KatS3mg043_1294 [Rhodothermaceae bacterium]
MNRFFFLFALLGILGEMPAAYAVPLELLGSEHGPVALLQVQEAVASADAVQDTTSAAASEQGLQFNDLWDLVSGAQGFQYPIFLTLILGLFLIFGKVYELVADRRAGNVLERVGFHGMDLRRIVLKVSNQPDSMMARLAATLLNVFQTQGRAETLHDEIVNFVRFQQDRFDTFKRRVDFLSDTAGALGLLGTVWGIFSVFSAGTSDKQQILIGMGVALITTLLGLIVSIILNLSSTEVFSFFNRRLDQITNKADELRFRLMEIAMQQEELLPDPEASWHEPGPAPGLVVEQGTNRQSKGTAVRPASPPRAVVEAEVPSPRAAVATMAGASPETLLQVEEMDVTALPASATVGTLLEGLQVQLRARDGVPVPGEQVVVEVLRGEGRLGTGQDRLVCSTNDAGTASFDWRLGTKAGPQTIRIQLAGDQRGDLSREVTVMARAGAPEQYAQHGNNQGAPVGQALPKPLVVCLQDAYGNPVAGFPVTFAVEQGDGTFSNGAPSITVTTDDRGCASAGFTTGKMPGLNTIKAHVEAYELTFHAMGLEN